MDALEWLVGWLHDAPDFMPPDFPWRVWPQQELEAAPRQAAAAEAVAAGELASDSAASGWVA